MLFLSIWTGAWTGRAGILAETCSFFLITPEILSGRLIGLQETLKGWLERWDESSMRLHAFNIFWGSSLAFWFCCSIPSVMLTNWPNWTQTTLVASGVESLAAGAIAMEHEEPWRRPVKQYVVLAWRTPRHRTINRVLLVIGVLGVAIALLMEYAAKATVVLAESTVRLLASKNRLRALVFSGGAVLFIGGMAAQFVATF